MVHARLWRQGTTVLCPESVEAAQAASRLSGTSTGSWKSEATLGVWRRCGEIAATAKRFERHSVRRKKGESNGSMLPLPVQFLAARLAAWFGRVLRQQVDRRGRDPDPQGKARRPETAIGWPIPSEPSSARPPCICV